MGTENIIPGILAISLAGIILIMGLLMTTELYDNVEDESNSYNQTFINLNGTANTLTHEPTASTLTATRKNNSWLSFDGVNDEVHLAFAGISKSIRSDRNHTWSVWFNSSNSGESDEGRIFDISPNSWSLGVGSNSNNYQGKLIYQNKNATNYYNLNSSSLVNDSIWHHALITFFNETGNMTMWIDGVIVNSMIMLNPLNNGAILDLSSPFSTSGLLGYLDEIRFYNRSLSSSETSEIYNSGRTANSSLPSTGLVLWLPLNEGSGTSVHSFNQSDFT